MLDYFLCLFASLHSHQLRSGYDFHHVPCGINLVASKMPPCFQSSPSSLTSISVPETLSSNTVLVVVFFPSGSCLSLWGHVSLIQHLHLMSPNHTEILAVSPGQHAVSNRVFLMPLYILFSPSGMSFSLLSVPMWEKLIVDSSLQLWSRVEVPSPSCGHLV